MDGSEIRRDAHYIVYDEPVVPTLLPKIRAAYEEKICLAFRVPYWVATSRPRPSWLRRPIWRFRALRWRWL